MSRHFVSAFPNNLSSSILLLYISCDTIHNMDSVYLCIQPTVFRSHSSRSTSTPSFKWKPPQLHWQWEMDLIAREQLVSSLKNHHVRILFFTHPVRISRVLHDTEKIGKYQCKHDILFFFFLLCNAYDSLPTTVKRYTVTAILCVKHMWRVYYIYHEREYWSYPMM